MTYNANGQQIFTAVSGTSYTGLYNANGSCNVVLTSDNTTWKGSQHPCGAYWGTVVTTQGNYYAIDGSVNIISNSDGTYSPVFPLGAGIGPASYLGVVATRGSIPQRQNTFGTSAMSRSAHIARDTITALQIVTGNWFVDGGIIGGTGGTYLEKGTGVSQVRTASIEYPTGTYHQVKWSAATSITEVNLATVISDQVAVSIPTGATFFVNMYVTNTAGVTITVPIANVLTNLALGDKFVLGGGVDDTMTSFTDGGSFGAAGGYGNYPLAIVAQTKKPSVLTLGSSRTFGIYETVDSSGDLGIVNRSVGPYWGYIGGGISGDAISNIVASHANRLALAQYVTHIIIEGPTNDSQASGLAAIEANLQTVWGYFTSLGKKVYATTCDPETTGAWTLVAQTDQTISKDFETIGVNPYIRGAPAPLSGAFDITSVTATGVLGNRYWNANGTAQAYTFDGTHETQLTNLAIKTSGVVAASAFNR